jgi:hypothetical protein
MKLLGLLSILLLAGCVAREQPHPDARRFESAWRQAEDWGAALARLQAVTQGGRPASTALFWPEHADKPGLEVGRLAGFSPDETQRISEWRNAQVLDRSYRIEQSFEPVPEGQAAVLNLAAPDAHSRWRVPPGWEWQHPQRPNHPRLEVDRDGSLLVWNPWGIARARIVFRLEPEPLPTSLYRHGDEVTVASWGVALRPEAIEFSDAGGKVLGRLFLAPAK